MSNTQSILEEVAKELTKAEEKFASFNSSHEGYAVLLEEVDELWDVVKLNPKKNNLPVTLGKPLSDDEHRKLQNEHRTKLMRAEAIQVAAMAIRFIKCVCDE